MAQLKPLTSDELETLVATAVQDAVDFIEDEIAPARIKAQKYFDGGTDIGEEPQRSRVVATKVRDTIRAIKPSLMRVFLSTDRPVEFVPNGPEDVPAAEQATRYMHWKWQELGGFRLLNDAFHDALLKRTGILKAYHEDYSKAEIFTFSGLSDEEFMAVVSDADVEVLEHSEVTEVDAAQIDPTTGQPFVIRMHDLKVSRTQRLGKMCVVSVPPEEFFVDRNARNIETAYVCGHRTDMRVGDLVAMGFAFDEVADLGAFGDADDMAEAEDTQRRRYSVDRDEDENARDPSMKKVTVTEAYMRVDADGTGVPVLHRFILGGTGYKLLDHEPWDEVPFAVFEVDPEPHAFFGRSIFDLVKTEQDAATAVLRGILDNVALTNNPRLGYVEGQVSLPDLMNNEIGGLVRMTSPGSIQAVDVPFVAGQTLPALQYLDNLVEQKTGVTRASMGLDPDALQSTTKAAVTATISAAAGQVETIARNLAEGGMRRLFKLMLGLMVKHSDKPTMMRLTNGFVPIDPRVWSAGMDVAVNVGLGTGREEEKRMALQMVLGVQQQILQLYGPQNGLVGLTQFRNTLADMLAGSGLRNADRFFLPMDAATEQQLLAMQAQMAAQQPQQDPAQALIMGEQIKAQTRLQADMARLQFDAQKAVMDDDRERDLMAQDLAVRVAEILGKHAVAVDTARIQAEQAMPRTM